MNERSDTTSGQAATIEIGMTAIERELIARGYRIKYRASDVCGEDCPTHDVWTYQLQRGEWTGGFRITDEVIAEHRSAPELVTYLERTNGWPRTDKP